MTSRGCTVGAVVTAFHPTEGLLTALAMLRPQVSAVVVVNDADEPAAADPVLAQAAALDVIVIDQGANRGIAAALNTGIDQLRSRLPELAAVLTCDQDSVLPAGYVDALIAAWQRATAAGVRVGMVAPNAAGNIAQLPGSVGSTDEVRIGGEPIQSGLLIPSDTLAVVGAFDESLFIDGVDSDFYLRAIEAGLVSVIAPVSIDHQLGRTTAVRLGSLRLELIVAADMRYYYRVRNLVRLVSRYFGKHPVWSLRAICKELRHQIVTTLFVPGRRARCRMSLRGLHDGLRGSTGRISD